MLRGIALLRLAWRAAQRQYPHPKRSPQPAYLPANTAIADDAQRAIPQFRPGIEAPPARWPPGLALALGPHGYPPAVGQDRGKDVLGDGRGVDATDCRDGNVARDVLITRDGDIVS